MKKPKNGVTVNLPRELIPHTNRLHDDFYHEDTWNLTGKRMSHIPRPELNRLLYSNVSKTLAVDIDYRRGPTLIVYTRERDPLDHEMKITNDAKVLQAAQAWISQINEDHGDSSGPKKYRGFHVDWGKLEDTWLQE